MAPSPSFLNQLTEHAGWLIGVGTTTTIGIAGAAFGWVIASGGLESIRVWLQKIHAPQSELARNNVRKGLELHQCQTIQEEDHCVSSLLSGLDLWRDALNKQQSWNRALLSSKRFLMLMLASMVATWICYAAKRDSANWLCGALGVWLLCGGAFAARAYPIWNLVVRFGSPKAATKEEKAKSPEETVGEATHLQESATAAAAIAEATRMAAARSGKEG